MYNIFRDFSDADEVVIPPKKDRRGKRYMFVRFKKVEDVRLTMVKLENIIIEGKKNYANVTIF